MVLFHYWDFSLLDKGTNGQTKAARTNPSCDGIFIYNKSHLTNNIGVWQKNLQNRGFKNDTLIYRQADRQTLLPAIVKEY